ncbi:hypothetical protein JHD47_05250 [Sulfurimonas sp. SAG-AH-194-L11]|nr:hypothetical protein [Sulfurimonas sp. SAG-AH-194-L11]
MKLSIYNHIIIFHIFQTCFYHINCNSCRRFFKHIRMRHRIRCSISNVIREYSCKTSITSC